MNNYGKVSASLLASAFCVWAASNAPMKDQHFAKEAAMGGMAEVKLGQLAVQKAESTKVKDFGQKMVDDHSKANDQLKKIAGNENITLPSDISPKDQALYDRLSGLSGGSFDKAYMSAMVKDHKTDVAAFEKEASTGDDDQMKNFASSTLPTLKGHLEMATQVAQSVGAH